MKEHKELAATSQSNTWKGKGEGFRVLYKAYPFIDLPDGEGNQACLQEGNGDSKDTLVGQRLSGTRRYGERRGSSGGSLPSLKICARIILSTLTEGRVWIDYSKVKRENGEKIRDGR